MRAKFARGLLVCGDDMFHSPIISYPLEEPYIILNKNFHQWGCEKHKAEQLAACLAQYDPLDVQVCT